MNSWSDDWAGTTAGPTSTNAMPTIEDIRRAMREFRRIRMERGPDTWILTHEEMQCLKDKCKSRGLLPDRPELASDPFSIYGIRIEEYATKQEVRARVIELAANGVTAGFLAQEEK
jgi:hypothetical protein